MHTTIVVNGEEYRVSDTTALRGFRSDAVEAVRAGGDLVRLDHDRGTVELLITSCTTMLVYASHPTESVFSSPPPHLSELDYL